MFFHFLSFSFNFFYFSFIFFHLSFIFLHFSFIFFHFLSFSFIFFHFLFLCWCSKFDFFGPQFRYDSLDSSQVKIHFWAHLGVVTPLWALFSFFPTFFLPCFLSFFLLFIFSFFIIFIFLRKKVSSFLFTCISFKYF